MKYFLNILMNANKINVDYWVDYFGFSFCFKSGSIVDTMTDFKVKNKTKRSSQESAFILFAFLSVIALAFLTSCEPKPLEIEIDPIETQTVVFSQIIPNQSMAIALTKTIDALAFTQNNGEEITQSLIEKLLVSDAKVTVAYRDEVDTLLELTAGLYGSIQTPQYVNEVYTLQVETPEGQILTASTTMLPKVNFEHIQPTVKTTGSETHVSVSFQVKDTPEDNWYMVNFYSPQTENNEEVNVNNLFGEEGNVLLKTELFSDEDFTNNVYENIITLQGVSATDSLFVTVSNINEIYYDFLTLRQNAANIITEITREPITSPTNIEGGLGFFNMHFPDIKFFDLNEY